MNERPMPGGSAPAGGISAPFSPGRCPLCGAVIEPGHAFCIACGTPLAPPEAAAPAASPLPASKAFSASRREIIAAFVRICDNLILICISHSVFFNCYLFYHFKIHITVCFIISFIITLFKLMKLTLKLRNFIYTISNFRTK